MKKKTSLILGLFMCAALTACSGPAAGGAINQGESGNDNNDAQVSDSNVDNTDTEPAYVSPVDDNTDQPASDDSQSSQPAEVSENDWKAAYLEFLDDFLFNQSGFSEGEYEGYTCGFIYVNEDDIPELVIDSGFEAAGRVVATYAGGKVSSFNTSRMGLTFIPKTNVIDNEDGIMGYNYHNIYTIDENEGFVLAATGTYSEVYDDNGFSGEYEYTWNDEEVTKEEFDKKLEAEIDIEDAVNFYQGTRIDYIRDFLAGNFPDNFKEAYMKMYNDGFRSVYDDSTYPAYAVLDSNGNDPVLVASGSDTFSLCSFRNGVLTVGPDEYVGGDDLKLIYPDMSMFMTVGNFGDTYYCNNLYFVQDGSILTKYFIRSAKYGDDGNPVTDSDGDYVFEYTINYKPVEPSYYQSALFVYDEHYKIQYAAYDADETYMEYVSGDALEAVLKNK